MERINIAVIDSNLKQRREVVAMLYRYLRGRPIRASLTEFDSGPELICEIVERGGYDIYIMEVMLPEMNGILLAEQLRSRGDRGTIIYLSKDPNDAYQAFRVRASDYLLTPLNEEKLHQSLNYIFAEFNRGKTAPVVEIKIKTGITRVPVNSITYVDIVDRALCFHIESGRTIKTKCVRGTFSEAIEKSIGARMAMKEFVLVGRACLLNLSYIIELGRGTVLLKTGEVVYIPRSAERNIKEAWKQYMF